MKSRTITSVSALIAVALVTAGCTTSSPDPSGTGSEERKTIGLQLSLTGIQFFQNVIDGGEQGAADGDVDIRITGPANIQPDVAISQFTALQSQVDPFIAVHGAPGGSWVRPLGDATASGIKITTLADAPAPGTDVPIYVGDNGERSGRYMITQLLPLLPTTTGKIVVGNCVPGFATQDNRIKGMIEELADQAPGIEVVSAEVGIEPAENLASWQSLVETNPEAIAFLGNCDTSGTSLSKVKEEKGGNYLIATFDINAETLAAIKDGTMSFALGGSPYLIGYVATRLLAVQAHGGTVNDGWYDTGAELVDSSNIDAVLAREASTEALASYYSTIVEREFADPTAIPTRPLEDALNDLPASSIDSVVWFKK